jgi:hypothetical protein
MADSYMDCPWRERGQWWGDARVEALVNFYTFGDPWLLRSGLRQLTLDADDGLIPGVSPSDFESRYLPDYALIWVLTLRDYLRYTGDQSLVRELWPALKANLAWFDRFRDADGLLRDVPGWIFIDWADVDKSGSSAALNAFYYGALRAAAEMQALIGEPGDYGARASALQSAFPARFWDESRSLFRDADHPGQATFRFSEQTNALAVAMGLTDGERAERVMTALADSTDVTRAGTPYFEHYVLQALRAVGRHTDALGAIRQKWGAMLDGGATTWWETWRPDGSLCHAWSAAPTYDLPASVLGIRPARDGWQLARIEPHLGDLSWAEATVPTPRGALRVRCRQSGTGLELRVQLPPGVSADVILPGRPQNVSANGSPVLRGGRPAASSSVMSMRQTDAGLLIHLADGGRYDLVAR